MSEHKDKNARKTEAENDSTGDGTIIDENKDVETLLIRKIDEQNILSKEEKNEGREKITDEVEKEREKKNNEENLDLTEKKAENDQTNCQVCENKIKEVADCTGCRRVQLCSLCLQRHRYTNKCLPWRAERRRAIGRCLVANREIKPLEVVLVDTSVIVVPAAKLSCLGCGRPVNCRYTCSGCNLPLCGSQCPLLSHHEAECELMSSQQLPTLTEDSDLSVYSAVSALRVLRLKDKTPIAYETMHNLETHFQHIRSDVTIKDTLDYVVGILTPLGFAEEDIIKAFGLIKINSYPVSEVENGSARAIFPIRALLNHSCTPNLQYIEKEGGQRIVLQAVRTISQGEILTVRYVPFLQGRITIGRKLQEHWYFQCTCPRCKDGTEMGTFTSSALCENKPCNEKGSILLLVDPTNIHSDWICPSCQTLRSQSYVEQLEQSYIDKFKSLPQCDLPSFYNFLNELGERFHSSHHLVMRMAKFLVLFQGRKLESLPREQIETQSLLCDKLLTYISRLDPGATQTRAKFLLEKNKADLNLAKRDCEAGKISRKVFMSKIKEGVRTEVNAKKILFFQWEDK